MFKAIQRIPAGTFLIPMLVSSLLYTFWPTLFHIGGITQNLLGGEGVNAIIGGICFCAGASLNLRSVGKVLSRQGVLLLVKLVLAVGLGLLYIYYFRRWGIFGVSALAFVVTISSINPAVYVSLANEYGSEIDASAFALMGVFSIPAVPTLIYGIADGGALDLMPMVSTLVPMLFGSVLGTLDRDWTTYLSPAVGPLTSLMGWGLGQSINLLDAVRGGMTGVLLTVVFLILSSVLFFVDWKVLKQDGIVGLMMISVAGLSVSAPAVLADIYPERLAPFVEEAQAQILMAVVITSVIMPIITGWWAKKQGINKDTNL